MLQAAQQGYLFVETIDSGPAILFTRVGADEQFFYSIILWRIGPQLLYFVDCAHTTFAQNLHNLKFSVKDRTYWESHTNIFSKCAQIA